MSLKRYYLRIMIKFKDKIGIEFRSEIRKHHKEFVQKLVKAHPQVKEYFANNIIVEFSPRMTTCGGFAVFERNTIVLSYIIHKINSLEDLKNTYGHELCHLVAHFLWKRCMGHKKQWVGLMKLLGEDAHRCHSMRTRRVRRYKKFVYNCFCRGHVVESWTHTRCQRGEKFVCGDCGYFIEFDKQFHSTTPVDHQVVKVSLVDLSL
jgi:predicted SprT family Zn-dependent metalloprotease